MPLHWLRSPWRRRPVVGALALLRIAVSLMCLTIFCLSAKCEHIAMVSTVTGGTRDEQWATKPFRFGTNLLVVLAFDLQAALRLWQLGAVVNPATLLVHRGLLALQTIFDIGQEVWRWEGHAWLAAFAGLFGVLQTLTAVFCLLFAATLTRRSASFEQGAASAPPTRRSHEVELHVSSDMEKATENGRSEAIRGESAQIDAQEAEIDPEEAVWRCWILIAFMLALVVAVTGGMMLKNPGGPPPEEGGHISVETGHFAMLEYTALGCFLLSQACIEQAMPARALPRHQPLSDCSTWRRGMNLFGGGPREIQRNEAAAAMVDFSATSSSPRA